MAGPSVRPFRAVRSSPFRALAEPLGPRAAGNIEIPLRNGNPLETRQAKVRYIRQNRSHTYHSGTELRKAEFSM